MPFAIELSFDSSTDRAVREAWRRLHNAGIAALGMPDGAFPEPHLSLAVADSLPVKRAAMALRAMDPRGMRLRLAHLGFFAPTGGNLVAFIGAAPTAHLIELNRQAIAILDANGWAPWDLYRPEIWVPHCTLAMAVRPEDMQLVALAAADLPSPLDVEVAGYGLYDLDAATILPIASD